MSGPCRFALAAAKVPSKRFRTRADLIALLEPVRLRLEEARRPLELEALADEVGLSPFHLQRLFRATYGVSPREFGENLRMLAAKEMLRSGAKPIEIFAVLHYSELSAFSRAFKRRQGLSPSAFCKKCQTEVASTSPQ